TRFSRDWSSDVCSSDLDALDAVLSMPVVYAAARAGVASLNRPADGELPDGDSLDPLFDVLLEHIPAPQVDPDAPLRALVTNLDRSEERRVGKECRARWS